MSTQSGTRVHAAARAERIGEEIRAEGSGSVESRGRDFSRSAADYFVPSLPSLPDLASHPTHPLNIFSGVIPSYPGEEQGGGTAPTGVDAEIFFMMIKARRSAGKSRVIFWFNGGPGCSSFDGSLMEVGPFRTVPAAHTKSGKVELRLIEGGWEEFATIVFVDQPPGTGLSTIPTNGYLHELGQAAAHLIKFMQNFYEIFPDLKAVDTYLAGESFAGQYIPYFADAIIKNRPVPEFNLVGLAIGNGWIDPREQYQGYVDFAYEKGLIKHGSKESVELDRRAAQCKVETDQWTDDRTDVPVNLNNCGSVMGGVTDPYVQELNGKRVCMNVYDTRLVDDWPACGMNWPPDLSDVYEYLRDRDVVNALHAQSKETAWVECDGSVSNSLYMQKSPASVLLLPGILDAGIQIMMFAGAEDLICNYVGIERTIERMKWAGEQGLGNATKLDWQVNGTYAGFWQSARNLTYVNIADASHMVGFDVPHVSNDMMIRFMGVDITTLPGVTAKYPSTVGDIARPQLSVVGTDEGSSGGGRKSTNYDAWYNAGSAIVVLLFIVGAVGLYFHLRARSRFRRARVALMPERRDDEEERVPFGAESYELEANGNGASGSGYRDVGHRSKKRTSGEEDQEDVVFELGDDDDDEGRFSGKSRS